MHIRYNVILIPLLIVVALAVWFLTTREHKQQAARRITDRALVNADDVTTIELVHPDQTVRLEKLPDGSFGMTSPYTVGCVQEKVTSLLDGIFKAESERDLTGVTTDQLAEYGLDKPEDEVKLSSGDRLLMDLYIGNANPQGTDRYGMLSSDESTVFLIPVYYLTPILLTPDKLRDPFAVKLDPATVTSMQISSAASDIAFEKRDGTWFVTSPDLFPASPSRLDILFRNLRDLSATEFLPTTAVDPELAVNSIQVQWSTADNPSAGSLILHGEDYHRGIFATSSFQPTPFLVQAYISDRLSLDPNVFFHVLLVDLPADQIKRIIVRQPGSERLEIEQTGQEPGAWRILKPSNARPATSNDFTSFLNALIGIQPKRAIEPPAQASDYGLEPVYFIKIEVYSDAAEPVATIYLGSQDPEGDYYGTKDGSSYFVVAPELVGTFVSALDTLRTVVPTEQTQ